MCQLKLSNIEIVNFDADISPRIKRFGLFFVRESIATDFPSENEIRGKRRVAKDGGIEKVDPATSPETFKLN